MSRDTFTAGYMTQGPLLTKKLVEAGENRLNAFSFYMADAGFGSNSYSFIDFNGFVIKNIKGGALQEPFIEWIQMEPAFFW
jgi:hypothetical protein